MAEVKTFVLWFLENLPSFLMAEPIKYFIGFVFLAFTLSLFVRIKNIGKGGY